MGNVVRSTDNLKEKGYQLTTKKNEIMDHPLLDGPVIWSKLQYCVGG